MLHDFTPKFQQFLGIKTPEPTPATPTPSSFVQNFLSVKRLRGNASSPNLEMGWFGLSNGKVHAIKFMFLVVKSKGTIKEQDTVRDGRLVGLKNSNNNNNPNQSIALQIQPWYPRELCELSDRI